MKKVKLAALLTALALSVTAFAACGKDKDSCGTTAATQNNWETLKISDVYNSDYDETANEDAYKNYYAKAKRVNVPELTGFSFEPVYSYNAPNNESVLRVFKKYDATSKRAVYKLYNLTLNKVVKTLTFDKTAKSPNDGEGVYVSLSYLQTDDFPYSVFALLVGTEDLSTGAKTNSLYGLDGTLLSDKTTVIVTETKVNSKFVDNKQSFSVRFTLGDSEDATVANSYAIENVYCGEITKLVSKQPVNEIKEFERDYTKEIGDYNCLMASDRGHVYFYDKTTGELKSTLDISDSIEGLTMGMAANGKILCQYVVLADPDSTDYDCAQFNEYEGVYIKFNIKSYVFDPANGNKTEIKLDYVIYDIYNTVSNKQAFKRHGFKDSVENVAAICKIANKSVGDEMYVVLSNDFTVLGRIDNYIPDQEEMPVLVGDGVYRVSCHSDSDYFLNVNGEVIGKMFDGNYNYYANDFVRYNNAIYNLRTLDKVFDLNSDDYTASVDAQNFGGNLVIRKTYTVDGISITENLLIKCDSSVPVTMFITKEVANYGVGDDYYYYATKLADGNYRFVYKDTDGETLYDYVAYNLDDIMSERGMAYSYNGVNYKTEEIDCVDANGEKTTLYYRVTK